MPFDSLGDFIKAADAVGEVQFVGEHEEGDKPDFHHEAHEGHEVIGQL